MVQMNLSSGSSSNIEVENERTCGHRAGVGWIGRLGLTYVHCHKQMDTGILYTWLLLKHLSHCIVITGEDNGNPLQYSCLENPMGRGAWWAAVHGVAKRRTRLSDFTFTFYFHALEKGMTTHSSVLTWRISGTGEPGGLPSMGSHRIGHYWSNLAAAAEL